MSTYGGRLLRVNLTERTAQIETIPEQIQRDFLGGRGFAIKYLYDELKPGTDPFSPENKLLMGVGPLCGTNAQGCSKFVVSTKSPASGGFIRAISGDNFGARLKFAGFDFLIIEGKSDRPSYVSLSEKGAEIRDASDLWGLDTEKAQEALRQRHGNKIEVSCIGPAGERLVLYAAVVNGRRTASRGGVGAVMGSKNLKAVVISGERSMPKAADQEQFKSLCKEYVEILKANPRRMSMTKNGSMSAFQKFAWDMSVTPCRNFTRGSMEGMEKLYADEFNKLKEKESTCYNCMTRCGQVRRVKEGPYAGAWSDGPEYETTFSLGSNLYNTDIGSIIAGDALCDIYGIDTISTGVAIGFAFELFERGIITKEDTDGLELNWGNSAAVISMIHKIGKREGLGRLLGEGVKRAAEQIGQGSEVYAIHAKGVELPGYEPRAVKGYALSYAVSNIGGSHMYGRPQQDLGKGGEPLLDEGKGQQVLDAQIEQAVNDSVIVCNFGSSGLTNDMRNELLKLATGFDEFADGDYISRLGERVVCLERAFNVREGLRRKDDNLPSRILNEPLMEAKHATGEVVRKMEILLDEYYQAAGYTSEGVPTSEKLEKLGLGSIADDLKVNDEITETMRRAG